MISIVKTIAFFAFLCFANCDQAHDEAVKHLCADNDQAKQMFNTFYTCSLEGPNPAELQLRKDCFKEALGVDMPSDAEATRKIVCVPENLKKMSQTDACEDRLAKERKLTVDKEAHDKAMDACMHKDAGIDQSDPLGSIIKQYCAGKGSVGGAALKMIYDCETKHYTDAAKKVAATCFKTKYEVDRPATFDDEMKAICAKDPSKFSDFKVCTVMAIDAQGLKDETMAKNVKACMH